MANRFDTPIMFALEKNITFRFARVVFQTGGNPLLDTNNSKGICNVAYNTPVFTGSIGSGSSTVNSVSSFQGLFTGMTVTGTGVNASTTIGTISPSTGSIVLSQAATAGSTTFTAAGGQFIVQFGTQAGVRLDTFNKLLAFYHNWDESTGSASYSATTAQVAPNTGTGFIIKNNTGVRTIPSTSTSNSTDATLTVQFGLGNGTGFVATNPANGEAVRMAFVFGNSSAI